MCAIGLPPSSSWIVSPACTVGLSDDLECRCGNIGEVVIEDARRNPTTKSDPACRRSGTIVSSVSPRLASAVVLLVTG